MARKQNGISGALFDLYRRGKFKIVCILDVHVIDEF